MPRRLFVGLAKAALPALVLLLAVHLVLIRPSALRWGATDEEAARAMTGDWVIQSPAFNATRAVGAQC